MRSVSQPKVLVAHIAVGILAFAPVADAATTQIFTDTTITTDITGNAGTNGGNDANGGDGNFGIFWADPLIDVIVASGHAITGGNGGLGGPDAANDGGNEGGSGAEAIYIFITATNGSLVTNAGVSLVGGFGGSGSAGGAGGGSDTYGADGGFGASGLGVGGDGTVLTLNGTTVTGGQGGDAGDAGDAVADVTDATWGGNGGAAGDGIYFDVSGGTINILSSTISGGDGGSGGISLANASNASADGGDGGDGIVLNGSSTTIVVGVGSIVKGGNGGAAGAGGAGSLNGAGGDGMTLNDGTSLTNYGQIFGGLGGMAIRVFGDGATIDNHGVIGAAGNDFAVFVGNGNTLAELHNRADGVIHGNSGANVIRSESGATITSFVNEGSIIGFDFGPGVYLAGPVGTFTNSGTIQAGDAAALTIGNAGVADTIDNTGGIIKNSSPLGSTVLISADLGLAGISFDGGQIVNSGGGDAIFVLQGQTGAIAVKNATIHGGIKFNVAGETLDVTAATLDGDVNFTGNGNNLNFLANGTSTIVAGTEFSNAQLFSLNDQAIVVSNAAQTDANSSISNLQVNDTAHLTLNQDFWVDNQVLNSSEIEIAAGKTLTANTVGGGGTFIFGATNAATVGKIVAQGANSGLDFTNASFEIKLTNPAAMFVAGTNFLIAQDQNNTGISGITDGTLLADNSALLNFLLFRGDAAEIGQTADLLFAQVQILLLVDIAGQADDPNAAALGAALDAIGLDGNQDIDDLMLDLTLLGTNEEINDALDSLLPETDGVAYDIATDASDQMLDVASRRLDGLRGSAAASLEYRVTSLSLMGLRGTAAPAARNQFWGQAFGRAVEQSKHDYNDGYDAGSYGFAAGADTALDNATQLGAAFSYASTNADGDGINRTDTEVDSYQLTLYGDHLFDNRIYAKGLIAYGWHNNDIARHDVGGIPGNTATGGYDASQFNLRAELGRAYAGGGNLSLIPHAALNAAWYSPDGYSEQGVGGLGLTVFPDDLTSVRLGLGVLARWDVKFADGELLQPELRLDYRRDLTQERFETTSEFLGAPGIAFRTQGVEPAADILNLGVGALLATAGGVDLRASYDVELKEDYVAHAGYVRASIPF